MVATSVLHTMCTVYNSVTGIAFCKFFYFYFFYKLRTNIKVNTRQFLNIGIYMRLRTFCKLFEKAKIL